MDYNQLSNATSYNRYPEIFREVSSIIPFPKQILSFGCSTGIECETLHQLYFKNSEIIGLDISEKLINENNKKNNIKNIKYYSNINEINNKFDIIFAMSVLCRWPEKDGEYTFHTFANTLKMIDSLLEINGYICIYNSKYLFTETELFKEKYEIIETKHKETGFVHKYHHNNNKLNGNFENYLFKKIK
jgi:hypothetical protein